MTNGQTEQFHFDPQKVLRTPNVVKHLVDKITTGMFLGMQRQPERRIARRYPLALVVDVQPLNDRFEPTGPSFQAVTRDISAGGIGLIHNQPLDSHLLGVQLWSAEGDAYQTVVEVIRAQPMGGIFDIGGRFVTEEGADDAD